MCQSVVSAHLLRIAGVVLVTVMVMGCAPNPLRPPPGDSSYATVSSQQLFEILRRLCWERNILLERDSNIPFRYIAYAFPSLVPIIIIEDDGEKMLAQRYEDMFDYIAYPISSLPAPFPTAFPNSDFPAPSFAPVYAGRKDDDSFYFFETTLDKLPGEIIRSRSKIVDLPGGFADYYDSFLVLLNDLDRAILGAEQRISIRTLETGSADSN